ncbi:MAG: UDP-N-acetylmuramoyl-tripeptide--D-alanyl-D-alanine ligase [Clostridia bacterium]|nr:UDP-N-acetylmuramoyl-tripeptide--D-alanyl-D-alanine ligase [Clostridia bacterium]
MKSITFKDAATAVKSVTSLDGSFDCVCTDTRKIEKDCLFIAIKGENFDGHEFAAKALELGAKAVICEKDCGLGDNQILVESTRQALLDLAGYYRSLFNIPVIGITGSVGKTTTKEMVHAVMSVKYNTLKNEGNLNNEIGVPLTLFRLDETHEAAVIEMGMSGFGEISRMTAAVRPDVAVISNIGVSHIEMLGSREGILKAKLEILESMQADAPVILNGDDDMLINADAGTHPVTYYGIENNNAKFKAESITVGETELEFDAVYPGGKEKVHLPFPGRHNVYNALAASAAGSFFGVDEKDAFEALKKYVPAGMRQRIVKKHGITFIEDCYNASPDSQAAALAVLGGMKAKRKIAVIGDMLELGSYSAKAHASVGEKAAQNKIDVLFTYGERSLETAKAAKDGVATVKSFSDKTELSNELCAMLSEGDAILFKASRGMKLEDVIYSIYSSFEGTD